jgi:hypothetical protein
MHTTPSTAHRDHTIGANGYLPFAMCRDDGNERMLRAIGFPTRRATSYCTRFACGRPHLPGSFLVAQIGATPWRLPSQTIMPYGAFGLQLGAWIDVSLIDSR